MHVSGRVCGFPNGCWLKADSTVWDRNGWMWSGSWFESPIRFVCILLCDCLCNIFLQGQGDTIKHLLIWVRPWNEAAWSIVNNYSPHPPTASSSEQPPTQAQTWRTSLPLNQSKVWKIVHLLLYTAATLLMPSGPSLTVRRKSLPLLLFCNQSVSVAL